uniref:Uncharacterized protein n=1 Tax=Moniliophthora roreri TaxID=221103 RepID=A0A0W0FN50_MONRR
MPPIGFATIRHETQSQSQRQSLQPQPPPPPPPPAADQPTEGGDTLLEEFKKTKSEVEHTKNSLWDQFRRAGGNWLHQVDMRLGSISMVIRWGLEMENLERGKMLDVFKDMNEEEMERYKRAYDKFKLKYLIILKFLLQCLLYDEDYYTIVTKHMEGCYNLLQFLTDFSLFSSLLPLVLL